MRGEFDLQVEEEGVDEVGVEGARKGEWSHHFLRVQRGSLSMHM